MLHPGFHALCFVIDPNKFSDVKDQFKQFMEYFGNDASDYAFVIMTFTTNENEYEDHFRSKIDIKHPVTSVFEFCKDKELFIDNKVSPAEKEEMIKDIFASIDSANVKKLTPHFSSRFKTLTEAAEAAKTDEAAKAAREAKAALKAAKAAEIKHKQEILMVERKALETYKRDFEKLITEQTDTKAAEAKAAEAELKKELQRERETSRAEIRELALKLDQLASKADEDSYKKDLERERQAFEAEKKRLEWEVAKQKGIADNFQAHARDLEQRVFQAQFFRSPFYYQPPTDSPKEKSFCTIL
ncbi:hypothetical protein DPMN_118029 [Dreissena polymorpha]|uniref:AIG1-type G domain-containing protein n=1 Tax=Dreissena polymorpha TaxID=45954 RepID=A0A9D4JPV5_DREPO|nr:hypothetical protein DPMN_118029 [Dreissena polymorpha]